MNSDSRQTIHIGIGYIFVPAPLIDQQMHLAFQKALIDKGISFAQAGLQSQEIVIIRQASPRLNVRLLDLPNSPLGQIAIISPDPNAELNLFEKEVEAIIQAFQQSWQVPNRQIISTEVTMQDLYESTSEHAFKELWEVRLKQPNDSLKRLGHPVLGGGLRFVMPPRPDEPEPVQRELRIESFLQDTRKIFLQTQFNWPAPKRPGEDFDPQRRLHEVDEYVENNAEAFIAGGQ